jgi:hypothetical protein
MREGTLREELQQGRARGGGSVLESMRTGVAFQRKSWRSRASCAVSRAPRSPVTLPGILYRINAERTHHYQARIDDAGKVTSTWEGGEHMPRSMADGYLINTLPNRKYYLIPINNIYRKYSSSSSPPLSSWNRANWSGHPCPSPSKGVYV